MKRLLQTLNEPFILWLLSSVVVGFVSWQYAEIQRNSTTRKMNEQVLRRAKLELKLQLKDVRFFVRRGQEMTMAQLGATLRRLQYNALNRSSEYYVPSIPNVMLEIDSRTGWCGLEKYQDRIYEQATNISAAWNRLWSPRTPPQARIYSQLSEVTLAGLEKLVVLADEVQKYYANKKPDCDAR